jgi:hypothetical protein
LEEKVAVPVHKNREYARNDPSRGPRGTLYPLKLALISLTSGGRSFGIVRSRTQATEFSLVFSGVRSVQGKKIPSNVGKCASAEGDTQLTE